MSRCELFISNQPALLEVAAGKAAVVELDAASILTALTNDADRNKRRTQDVHSGCDSTWSACVARLIEAMR